MGGLLGKEGDSNQPAKRIPCGWCADVCQATKDWAGSAVMMKETHGFSPAGWFDESPSSDMHEQVRLSGGIGRMEGRLMGPMVGGRSGRSGDTIISILTKGAYSS